MIKFSTKDDIIRTINSIDPYYAKTHEKRFIPFMVLR